MRVPFVIYADFETFNVKIDTCQPNDNRSYTQKIMKQVPSSFCFYAVSSVTGDKFEPVIYTAQDDDDDIGAMFNKALIEYVHMLYNKYEKYPKVIITESEQATHSNVQHIVTSVRKS
jgi:hypothetical protein